MKSCVDGNDVITADDFHRLLEVNKIVQFPYVPKCTEPHHFAAYGSDHLYIFLKVAGTGTG
jgi:hypothetical protein